MNEAVEPFFLVANWMDPFYMGVKNLSINNYNSYTFLFNKNLKC